MISAQLNSAPRSQTTETKTTLRSGEAKQKMPSTTPFAERQSFFNSSKSKIVEEPPICLSDMLHLFSWDFGILDPKLIGACHSENFVVGSICQHC